MFETDLAHKKQKYCNRSCTDAVWRQTRRALEADAFEEEIQLEEIFDKNNWVCGICGKKVNRKLKYPNPLSATLDHKIPLSLGGKHNKENVQLAHWICNIRKGNKSIIPNHSGQLMIV